METKTWAELTNDEKLDRLTSVLTRAGSDKDFRDRCLASPESALRAVGEAGAIEFLTPEQRLKKLVFAMPDFVPPEGGKAETRNSEDYQTCTYALWRS